MSGNIHALQCDHDMSQQQYTLTPSIQSDTDLQELNTVRSSQLVARMKSQLLTGNTSTKVGRKYFIPISG